MYSISMSCRPASSPDSVIRSIARSMILTASRVQDEYLIAFAHSWGRDHQLDRLGDGHEVPPGLRAGDGDGAARRDLILENGADSFDFAQDRAAAGSKDTPKPHGNRGRFTTFGHLLHQHLGQPLGGSHHAPGIDHLIRGNQGELTHALPLAGLDQVLSAEMLVVTTSSAFTSIWGTCLWAAERRTTLAVYRLMSWPVLSLSVISQMTGRISS